LGFVDNRHKRKDGSFDIKYELYGVWLKYNLSSSM